MKKRITVIIGAYVVASVAAGFVIGFFTGFGSAIKLSTAPSVTVENIFAGIGLGLFGAIYAAAFGGMVIGIGTLLPALAVIYFAERREIRSAWFYVLSASGVALVLGGLYIVYLHYTVYVPPQAPKPQLNLLDKDLLIFFLLIFVGGAVGGSIYWRIAGRNAGTKRGMAEAR